MTTLEKIRAEIFEKSVLMPHDRNFYIKVATVTMDAETDKAKVEDSDVLEIIDKYAEQEPCDDAISRNDMLDAVGHGTTYTSLEVQKIINGLPSVNPVPCDDVVSRQAVEDKLLKLCNELEGIFSNIRMQNQDDSVCGLCEYDCPAPYECPGFDIEDCFKLADERRHKWQSTKDLPPVRPQEQTGHWILDETDNSITCDKCGCLIWANDISNGEAYYCPNCGAKMVEPQESER